MKTYTLHITQDDFGEFTGSISGLVDRSVRHPKIDWLLAHLGSAVVADLHGLPLCDLPRNTRLPKTRKKAADGKEEENI